LAIYARGPSGRLNHEENLRLYQEARSIYVPQPIDKEPEPVINPSKYRTQVIAKIIGLSTIDGVPVIDELTQDERDKLTKLTNSFESNPG